MKRFKKIIFYIEKDLKKLHNSQKLNKMLYIKIGEKVSKMVGHTGWRRKIIGKKIREKI